MHCYSTRQQLIQDLFLIIVFLEDAETDDLIDAKLSLDLPHLPSVGTILALNDTTHQSIINTIFDDSGELEELLGLVMGCRYLEDRLLGRTCDEYNLAQLFATRDEDF